MTDLPQHEAIVSIMRHMRDPSFGFERYYDWAFDRTLYVFPYILATGLSYLVPVRWGLHITLFLATLSYPLGVLLTLRALRKPLILTLLSLPLVYNRGFFWGFIHFNFGIGLAFITLSWLVGPWSKKTGWIVAGLCLLTALTHIYGLVLLFSYAGAWLLAGERRQLLARAIWILPAAFALAAWGLFAAKAPGYGVTEWAPFELRLKEIGNSILGGYADHSEDYILGALVVLALALASRGLPWTWRRWIRGGVHVRVGYILILINLIAYFVLPVATPTAKFINFRHAVLAAMMLPFIISDGEYWGKGSFARIAAGTMAAVTLCNSWWHMWRFEREAADFNAVMAAMPEHPHIAQLTFESKGAIMRSHAYLHFGAYAQAQKGGVFAVSFPILFWNIPLKGRVNSGMPETPKNMEWAPGRFNEYRMGYFYDTVLIRQNSRQNDYSRVHSPYEKVVDVGSWKLYRRVRSDPRSNSFHGVGLDRG
jgi:hypothetical protein